MKEYSETDHILISDILAAFIRCEGRKAAWLMMEDSNMRLKELNDGAVDVQRYIDKIESLTIKASGSDYLMENLGSYITTICNAAAHHHIMMNQSFISAALAVKVQEGIALALDPSVEIWRVAIPIILEGERRRGLVQKRVGDMLGLDKMFAWLTGQRGQDENRNAKVISN